ncbi:hypothetical protein GCM10017744_053630 [Streptomyces antimycoticus]|uniref:Uncharacterized protein n=1 Tax=Streptomyces antimycoticus TaxID=68175 RepID=A0A4D4KCD4_9ACTN|nr:hypothetical protein [Streptomyces antimycoticus]GDY43977.1 hypothetical protein SANT12839_048590 [Streptomyces antimycoticus]
MSGMSWMSGTSGMAEAKTTHGTRATAGGGTRRPWRRLRAPWTVACVAATVLLGSSAAVASALGHSNAAPGHAAAAAVTTTAATAETTGGRSAVPARWRP